MPDRRDDLDSWLDGRIDPLPPPPGTFELIKRRARRRKYRRLAVGAGAAAVIVAAAVTVPQVVNLPVLNPATAARAASGRSSAGRRGRRGQRRVVLQPRPARPAGPGAGAGQLSAHFGHVHRHAHGLGDRPGRDARPLRHAVLHLGRAHRRRREDLDRRARAADRPGRRGRRGEPDPVPERARTAGRSGRSCTRRTTAAAPGPGWAPTGCGSPTWRRWRTGRSRCSPPAPGPARRSPPSAPSYTLYSSPAVGRRLDAGGRRDLGAGRRPGAASLVLTGDPRLPAGPGRDALLRAGGRQRALAAGHAVPCPVGQPLADGQPTGALLAAQNAANLVLACASSSAPGTSRPSSIFTSADGGISWQNAGPRPALGLATSVAASPDGAYVLATGQGLDVRPAGSATWQAAALDGPAPARAGSATWA